MDITAFLADEKTKSAVVWKITNIGEAAKNIPSQIRLKYRSVPWKDMARMRDKIAYLYLGVDYELVWGIATVELPGQSDPISRLSFRKPKGPIDVRLYRRWRGPLFGGPPRSI